MSNTNENTKSGLGRGLPSVNESRKNRSYKGLLAFVFVLLFVGGGAAFFVYLKFQGTTQGKSMHANTAEPEHSTKPRVFGQPLNTSTQEEDSDRSTAGLGSLHPQINAASSAPPVPPSLNGGRNGGAQPASAEAAVPAINVIGSGQGQPTPPSNAAYTNAGRNAPQVDTRSRFDTPFTVNGGVQPGGRAGAGSPLDEAIRKGNEALAAATTGQSMPGGMLGSPTRTDSGKGALTGLLTPTSTPMVRAGILGNQNLTARKGTPVECVLSVRIVAMLPGLVRCTLTSPLFSANGKVILADRGSEVVGEQSGTMRQGQTRLYVLWSEINTPEGVTIPIDSPGADALGASGVEGEVNNHWGQRIGASLMLSLIDDAFAYEIAKAGASSGTTTQGVAFQSTQQQSQRIAEKVLDSTINIPPTLYKMQGEKLSIIIMRHLDFSSVYSLEPK